MISRKVPNIWKLGNISLNNQWVSKEITKEISMYHEMSNENIIHQSVGYNEIEHGVKSIVLKRIKIQNTMLP